MVASRVSHATTDEKKIRQATLMQRPVLLDIN